LEKVPSKANRFSSSENDSRATRERARSQSNLQALPIVSRHIPARSAGQTETTHQGAPMRVPRGRGDHLPAIQKTHSCGQRSGARWRDHASPDCQQQSIQRCGPQSFSAVCVRDRGTFWRRFVPKRAKGKYARPAILRAAWNEGRRHCGLEERNDTGAGLSVEEPIDRSAFPRCTVFEHQRPCSAGFALFAPYGERRGVSDAIKSRLSVTPAET
jgi:hypothetical protein